jgi:hypothetical protein
MNNPFFDHPIINSPYKAPKKHWELDEKGQPTQNIVEERRSAKFITSLNVFPHKVSSVSPLFPASEKRKNHQNECH